MNNKIIEDFNYKITSNYNVSSSVQQLVDAIANLDENQFDTFFMKAQNVINDFGLISNDDFIKECRTLKCLADAVALNKNEQYIDKIAKPNNIPYVARLIVAENIKDKVLKDNGVANNYFVQSGNTKISKMPMQGFKLHISADNMEQLFDIYSVVIPELQEKGVFYKMIHPELLDEMNTSQQIGKVVTIYMNSDALNEISEDARKIMFDRLTETKPVGDTQLSGATFVRFGRFTGSAQGSFITNPDGSVEYDPKTYRKSHSSFINEKDLTFDNVINFYKNIQEELSETKDLKSYYQSYYTMAKSDGKNYAYMTFEMDKKKADVINVILNCKNIGSKPDEKHFSSALQPKNDSIDQYGLSFVVDHPTFENKSLVFIHQSTIPKLNIIKDMAKQRNLEEIDFFRPKWDMKQNFYTINKSNFENISGLIRYQEANSGNQKLMSMVKFDDGNYGVRVDASYNRIFENIMNERGLSFNEKEMREQTPLQKLAVTLKLMPPQYIEVDKIDRDLSEER